MSDQGQDQYKETARLTYESLLEMRRLSFAAQADYGKWLISSIFLMHGSAIGGLAFKTATTGAPSYLAAILWFVIGMILALGAGFSAWWNFSLAAQQYDGWAKPAMLFNRERWPSEATKIGGIRETRWISIGCGVLSVLALLGGALHVFCAWK